MLNMRKSGELVHGTWKSRALKQLKGKYVVTIISELDHWHLRPC